MLVGRDLVLAAAETALESARAGRGRVLALAGEAGIGKTTVARAIVDRAADTGATVRWGACWEAEASLPYAVWIDCLRRPAGDACAAVAERLEHGAFEMASDAAAAERQRVRFFAEVVDALREVSSARPQVLVLEDVHWADRQSLELLRAVTGHLPSMAVLVVATYRDDEVDPGGPLRGIGGGVETITLDGLGRDAVAVVLAEVLTRAPTADEVRTVHERTGGNPLFVTQVGRLVAVGSPSAMPGGVRDVLARRLARVSPPCDRVLGIASVLGTEFDVATVAAVLGVADDAVLGALDEALGARLVAPLEGRADRWSFVHALVGAARYEALGTTERADCHRRVVDALSTRSGVPAGVLAHHVERGRFDADDPRPAQLTIAAAREALGRLAWDDATRLAARALDRAPAGSAGDDVRAEASLALGDARLRAGDDAAAVEAFEAAAASGRSHGRAELVARAALGLAAGLGSFEVRVLDRRQVGLLEEAAAALPPDDPLRPLVLSRLSVALAYVDSEERRLALADEAVALARARGDARGVAVALAARCDARAGPDHVTERLGAASEVVAIAQRADDRALELLGRRLRVVALLELRDLPGLDAEIGAYDRTADRLGDPLYRWYVPLWRAMRAYADGRVDEALHAVEETGALGRAAGSFNAEMLTGTLRLFLAVDQREGATIRAQWDAMLASNPQYAGLTTVIAAMQALVDLHCGDEARGRAAIDRLGPAGIDVIPKDQEWLTSVAQFVVAGVATDHREVVRRAYELLLPYEGLGVFEGIAAVDHGVVDRFLALAAGYLGDAEAAPRHARRAVAAVAGAGRLVGAHTRADCARGLLATTDDSARALGHTLAQEAIQCYETLGFDSLARELRSRLGTSRSARRTGDDPDLASLVREGDTWAFTFGGATARVRHAKGVADLAVLLAHPGQDVHVRALEGVPDGSAPAGEQALLDDTAIAQYRRRLRELEGALEDADRRGDARASARLMAERDALVDELARARGLGGRRRAFGDRDERLRKAVSARVKASIERIEAHHPELGRHLRHSIRTGFLCAYEPERAVEWRVVDGADA